MITILELGGKRKKPFYFLVFSQINYKLNKNMICFNHYFYHSTKTESTGLALNQTFTLIGNSRFVFENLTIILAGNSKIAFICEECKFLKIKVFISN